MLKPSRIVFDLARTTGNKGPGTSGLLFWFACCLHTGVRCRAVDCVLCTEVLM